MPPDPTLTDAERALVELSHRIETDTRWSLAELREAVAAFLAERTDKPSPPEWPGAWWDEGKEFWRSGEPPKREASETKGGVAQTVEQRVEGACVAGSTPAAPTKPVELGGAGQLDDISAAAIAQEEAMKLRARVEALEGALRVAMPWIDVADPQGNVDWLACNKAMGKPDA